MQKEISRKQNNVGDLVIRFTGDSGDGMQLTGMQFCDTSALMGNDVATFPNYPAEIRAPQGSKYGVSGFQVHVSEKEIFSPGDELDLLVAMNPAALKENIGDLAPGKMLMVDSDAFSEKFLKKSGYKTNPLEDGSLDAYRVIAVPMTTNTQNALEGFDMARKEKFRSKNMYTLGIVYWMFGRELAHTNTFLETKFKNKPVICEANKKVLLAGNVYAQNLELIATRYQVQPAALKKGLYRIIRGSQAIAWGLVAASQKANMELFLGSYPITPASDILNELVKHPELSVKAFQAEDEIAAVSSAIGASFAGDLAVTSTSGPGLALKGEAIGLAMMTELPLVVINAQRGGPSTGMPTKTEQSDLLQALYGRNGESPTIVVAARSPAHCFDMAFEAARLTIEHMTPVVMLTDGFIGNGSEPWMIKKLSDLPEITKHMADTPEGWTPYTRNKETLAREWAIPGMEGFEHRIGGLEKHEHTGDVNMVPQNHETMTKIRAEKVKRVENYIPELEIHGVQSGKLLVVGWGGTFGALFTACKELREEGSEIGFAHFDYINPFPKNTEEVFSAFDKILVCELNAGQLVKQFRNSFPEQKFLQYNKIQGLPFTNGELKNKIHSLLSMGEK